MLRQAFLREDLLTRDALHLRSDEERRNTVFITELRQIANYYMGGKTMSEQGGSPSGLTSNEAKEFHSAYVQGWVGFVAIAVTAHVLMFMWKPWFY